MFPSDRYAVQSFLAMKGYDPDDAIVYWKAGPNSLTHDTHDLEKLLKEQGAQISLIWLEGVNFLSGQALDMAKITRLGHEYGCKVGFDLAHTAGNIPLKLHDWDVDFAAWCSYKYLNGGPGAIAGCYVNEKYVREPLAQLAGWYGNDPKTRFQFAHDFEPYPGAARWQISNPPILAMAPLQDSLALFHKATLPALRQKSLLLTSYLRFLVESLENDAIETITPADAHGCQLSFAIKGDPARLLTDLRAANVICDLRVPNIMRMAPVPLYNSFREVHDVYTSLRKFFN